MIKKQEEMRGGGGKGKKNHSGFHFDGLDSDSDLDDEFNKISKDQIKQFSKDFI